jgi:four helix bundle protein
MGIYSFEDLEVWKNARLLRTEFTILCKKFPSDEKYKLTDQLIRASRSITANIAEGFGRFHHQENIQFYRHSRGSLFECIDHLTVALDEKHITQLEFDTLKQKLNDLNRILNGYISYLKKPKELNN